MFINTSASPASVRLRPSSQNLNVSSPELERTTPGESLWCIFKAVVRSRHFHGEDLMSARRWKCGSQSRGAGSSDVPRELQCAWAYSFTVLQVLQSQGRRHVLQKMFLRRKQSPDESFRGCSSTTLRG